jgi:subtilisin family serine protease
MSRKFIVNAITLVFLLSPQFMMGTASAKEVEEISCEDATEEQVLISFEEGEIAKNIAKFYAYLKEIHKLPTKDYTVKAGKALAVSLVEDKILFRGYPSAEFDPLLCKLNPDIWGTNCDTDDYPSGITIQVPDVQLTAYDYFMPYYPKKGETVEEILKTVEAKVKKQGASEDRIQEFLLEYQTNLTQTDRPDLIDIYIPAVGYEVKLCLPRSEVENPDSKLFNLAPGNFFVTRLEKPVKLYSEPEPCEKLPGNNSLAMINHYYPKDLNDLKREEQAIVAIFDTEINVSHQDFWARNNVNAFENISSNSDSRPPISWDTAETCPHEENPSSFVKEMDHGTHLAGIIGARENQYGIKGVHPAVRLLTYGTENESIVEKLRDAIVYERAGIINMSWGFENDDSSNLTKLMRDYKKVLFVVAAGNMERQDHEKLEEIAEMTDMTDRMKKMESFFTKIPVCLYDFPNVITVGAMNSQNNNLWKESKRGEPFVHIAAPGESILSTFRQSQYIRASGTSQATAFVSGAAALLKSYQQYLSAEQIKERLMYTADLIPDLEEKLVSGRLLEGKVVSGRLNVKRALMHWDKDVLFLKTSSAEWIGELVPAPEDQDRLFKIYALGVGEDIKIEELRRIWWDEESKTYTVITYEKQKDGSRKFCKRVGVWFQPDGQPTFQAEVKQLAFKNGDTKPRPITLSNIRDLIVGIPRTD